MDFNENIDTVFDIRRKSHLVINSCTNVIQLDAASNYIENYKKWMEQLECRTTTQSDLLKQIILHAKNMISVKRNNLS